MLVAGAGSWGTAVAIQLARNGTPVLLWARDPAQAEAMARDRVNRRYLPDIPLPDAIEPCSDLDAALVRAGEVLLAVPCKGLAPVLQCLSQAPRRVARVAWLSKGLIPGTQRLVHELVAQTLGAGVGMAAISGPTFAREVALGLPTAVTVAANREDYGLALVELLHSPTFRAYRSSDLVGVEVGGAVKNVLAIAAGVADGLGFGANTRAALITRGLAEMIRLGLALGGQRETFEGLAGLGDLVLTCTDDQSRNRRLGLALAQGQSVQQALAAIGQAVEGAAAAPELRVLAARLGVAMPISEQVARVVAAECSPRVAVQTLLARDPKPEVD